MIHYDTFMNLRVRLNNFDRLVDFSGSEMALRSLYYLLRGWDDVSGIKASSFVLSVADVPRCIPAFCSSHPLTFCSPHWVLQVSGDG
jgi:hypothetical protein